MKKEELETIIADARKSIDEIRTMTKEKKQERAMSEKPLTTSETKIYADIQTAMKEKRTVTLSGTEDVSVSHTLVKALQDNNSLLSRFSIQPGGNKSQIIPVWNKNIGDFEPVGEDGTFTADESATLGVVQLVPHAFAKGIKVSDAVLKLSAIEFESELKEILYDSLSNTILKQVFSGKGTSGQFTNIISGATEKTCTTWTAKDLEKFVLETVLSKANSKNSIIMMNPTVYSELEDGTGNKDKILMEEIAKGFIKKVEIVLSPFVPSSIKCVAGDPANMGIGIADELDIKNKETAGTLLHNYDTSAYIAGKPIIPGDFFVLKAGE